MLTARFASMIVDCHNCSATYNVADEKVRGRRVRVRCRSCGATMLLDAREIHPDDATRPFGPDDATRRYAFAPDDATRVMTAPTSPGPEPGEWLVSVQGVERAMMAQAIAEDYNAGLIQDDAYVWRAGMASWEPVLAVEEIRSAIEEGEATRVVDAGFMRRSQDPRPPPAFPALPAPPARARYPEPAYSPPDVEQTDPEPVSEVEYVPPAPPPRATDSAPRAARRPASRRHNAPDLFGGAERAGSEEELLASDAGAALERYEAQPTGARGVSSVLFSLKAFRAGRERTSAPVRPPTGAPQSAAELLGMSSGGRVPGLSADAAALAAPAREPMPQPRAPVQRARIDTTPPAAGRRGQGKLWLLVGVASALTIVLGAVLYAMMAKRGSATEMVKEGAAAASAAAAPAAAAPAAAAPAEPPASARAPTASAAEQAAADQRRSGRGEPEPEPQQRAAPKAAQPAPRAPAVRTPARASKPAQPSSPASSPGDDALKEAIKPSGASTEPEASSDVPKIVLEEESSGSAEEPAEPTKPPFSTSAAKSALGAAAANAASCKEPDGPTGSGKIQVTFANSGKATSATVISGPFSGTSVGGCVARIFRGASVPAFSGSPVTVAKSFRIP